MSNDSRKPSSVPTRSDSRAGLPSRGFQPRIYGVGAWTAHLHFAYDLIAQLKPRVLVELGVDRGESYFAFCQSVAENGTGTHCTGIDTWIGDEHAGGYDETTFAEVSHHNVNYQSFSDLRRCDFFAALKDFADESIDLLHLDGLHTEDAVHHDLAAWLPKLRPGGILLLHDVGVRLPGFGVWKVWEELRSKGRAWTFLDSPGLGVWQKPPVSTLPGFLEDLFRAPNERALILADYYSARAHEMQERIAREWRDGTIRQSPFARQTIVQIFYSSDGQHRAEDSLSTRVGHNVWKDVTIHLPIGAGAAPLRIDFVSALTIIDLATITVSSGGRLLYSATTVPDFDRITVTGDAERLPHPTFLRLQVTGIDPQVILPCLKLPQANESLEVQLRLYVDPTGVAFSA
ncbi:MAG: class I SAM-dependent methyltransferase [Verrucomicrobiota bacterium]